MEEKGNEIQKEADQKATEGLSFPLSQKDLFALRKGGFIVYGTATLSSGTVAVTDRRIQASSIAFATYKTPAGTMGSNLKAVCTANTLTLTAVKLDTTTETSDTSTVGYLVLI